jgi:hypothetical protein
LTFFEDLAPVFFFAVITKILTHILFKAWSDWGFVETIDYYSKVGYSVGIVGYISE